jgi:hypothetical protein
MPQLQGKYLFGDITTGRIFYADLAEMLAKDDGDRTTLAGVHEVQVVFDSPYDTPDRGPVKRRMFDIVAEEYAQRGGKTSSGVLPGSANVTAGNDPDGIPYGGGRADIRIAVGGDGEIYVLSKSDGMIRAMAAVLAAPKFQTITRTNTQVMLNWAAFPGRTYRVQFSSTPTSGNWTNLTGDVSATGVSSSKSDVSTNDTRYYRVLLLP